MPYFCAPEGFAEPRPRNAPLGRFCPAGRKARARAVRIGSFVAPIKSMQNKRAAPHRCCSWLRPGGFRTSGLPGRRNYDRAAWTLKRELYWFCTFAAKTGKSLLSVITTGFSGIAMKVSLHSSGQMVVKNQGHSTRSIPWKDFTDESGAPFQQILS